MHRDIIKPHELDQLLKNLHLRKIQEIADEEMERANRDQIPYQDFLLRLIRAQWHAKQEKTLEWRIKNAKIPERWTLETFPFKKQPGINRRQIKTLSTACPSASETSTAISDLVL